MQRPSDWVRNIGSDHQCKKPSVFVIVRLSSGRSLCAFRIVILGFLESPQVQKLDRNGKGHGEIDIAFGDVLMQALSNQHDTN